MQRINVTLIVNMTAEEQDVDEVVRFLMERGMTCVSDGSGIPMTAGQVTSINVLEGLSLNVGFVPSPPSGSGAGSDSSGDVFIETERLVQDFSNALGAEDRILFCGAAREQDRKDAVERVEFAKAALLAHVAALHSPPPMGEELAARANKRADDNANANISNQPTRRTAASPHGPLPIPTNEELDRADRGDYDGFTGLVPKHE